LGGKSEEESYLTGIQQAKKYDQQCRSAKSPGRVLKKGNESLPSLEKQKKLVPFDLNDDEELHSKRYKLERIAATFCEGRIDRATYLFLTRRYIDKIVGMEL
jgi:hypothetical protein